MLSGIRSLIAFLTIIPAKPSEDSLGLAARYMPLFPLIGLGIGLVTGTSAWVLRQVFPPLLGGVLSVAVIGFVTGLHHIDGLLDFGDGVMTKGSKAQKIQAMHDKNTGAGGHILGFVVLLGTALTISEFNPRDIFLILVCAEVTAKTSMVLITGVGRSASIGMNTPFVTAMHSGARLSKVILPISATVILGLYALGFLGILAMVVSLLSAFATLGIANRHFGGITGDVLGAVNEIARFVFLLSLLGLIG